MTTNTQQFSPPQGLDAGTASRVFGVLRLIAAALVFASIATQVVDESIHNDFVAKEYFSYFTITRGLLDGWFPYPFLQPNGPDGWGGVAVYAFGIAAFIIAVVAALIGISRARWANTDRLWMARRS